MRIHDSETLLLMVDMQERLVPAMEGHLALVNRVSALLEGMGLLGIPCLHTEQYPQGLGPTIKGLQKAGILGQALEKLSFSCLGTPEILSALADSRRRTILVCGIEAHVCVLQTVLDLIEQGYRPVLLQDCIASRHTLDLQVAIQRMARAGVEMATLEMVLFELLQAAGTPRFKGISALVKGLD